MIQILIEQQNLLNSEIIWWFIDWIWIFFLRGL